MSEDPASLDEQTEAEQFNAEAAQKAKEFLDEGVTQATGLDRSRGPQYVPIEVSAIVDSEGSTINDKAEVFVNRIKREDEKAKEYKEQEAYLIQKEQTIAEVANTLKDLTPEQQKQLDEMRDMRNNELQDVTNQRFASEDNRDATLWRGRQHYLENQEGYVASAVEDANTAGHDVTLAGHTFPAQATEQQGEQTPQALEPPSQNAA